MLKLTRHQRKDDIEEDEIKEVDIEGDVIEEVYAVRIQYMQYACSTCSTHTVHAVRIQYMPYACSTWNMYNTLRV